MVKFSVVVALGLLPQMTSLCIVLKPLNLLVVVPVSAITFFPERTYVFFLIRSPNWVASIHR